jgi:hypothetical protein
VARPADGGMKLRLANEDPQRLAGVLALAEGIDVTRTQAGEGDPSSQRAMPKSAKITRNNRFARREADPPSTHEPVTQYGAVPEEAACVR